MTEDAAARWLVRRATAADAGLLAEHRISMWRDMGRLPADVEPHARRDAAAWFSLAIPDGVYHGWLAAPASDPDTVVAGGGFLLRPIIPTVRTQGGRTFSTMAPQALVVNVYTLPAWRRRGLARHLMRHLIDGARELGVSSIVLHASDEGRRLYEAVGFVGTNEMRFEEKE